VGAASSCAAACNPLWQDARALHRRRARPIPTTARPPLAAPGPAGTTYFDSLQQDASFITTTQDPAGFTLIDVFAW
jgi:hypothetical protein